MRDRSRVKSLYLKPAMVLELLAGPSKPERSMILAEGLPLDAEVVAADYDFLRRQFMLMIWSETFAPAPEGTLPDELVLACRRVPVI